MGCSNTIPVILLVTCVVTPLLYLFCKGRLKRASTVNRKYIIYLLMTDERIDAEYCLYLRLVLGTSEALWSTLGIQSTGEKRSRVRLRQLQTEYRRVEHHRVAGVLHILMHRMNIEKKQDVFKIKESVVRTHYFDFITGIKEEG